MISINKNLLKLVAFLAALFFSIDSTHATLTKSKKTSPVKTSADQPPTGKINGIKSEYIVGESVTASIQASDDIGLSVVNFQVADSSNRQIEGKRWTTTGKNFSQTYSFSTRNWDSGTYYYALWLSDTGGNNKAVVQNLTFKIKVTSDLPPTGTVSGINAEYTVGDTITALIQASDDIGLSVVNFQVADSSNRQIEGKRWTTTGKSFSQTYQFPTKNFSPGTYYFALWITDTGANNRAVVENQSFLVKADKSPTGTVSGINAEYSVGDTITASIQASDDIGLSVVNFQVADSSNRQIEGKRWTTTGENFSQTYSFSTRNWDSGTYYYALWLSDTGGNNKAVVENLTFKIKVTSDLPPTGTVSGINAEYAVGDTITASIQASDDIGLSVVNFQVADSSNRQIEGKRWTPTGRSFNQTYSFSMKNLSPGTYYYALWITDTGGNNRAVVENKSFVLKEKSLLRIEGLSSNLTLNVGEPLQLQGIIYPDEGDILTKVTAVVTDESDPIFIDRTSMSKIISCTDDQEKFNLNAFTYTFLREGNYVIGIHVNTIKFPNLGTAALKRLKVVVSASLRRSIKKIIEGINYIPQGTIKEGFLFGSPKLNFKNGRCGFTCFEIIRNYYINDILIDSNSTDVANYRQSIEKIDEHISLFRENIESSALYEVRKNIIGESFNELIKIEQDNLDNKYGTYYLELIDIKNILAKNYGFISVVHSGWKRFEDFKDSIDRGIPIIALLNVQPLERYVNETDREPLHKDDNGEIANFGHFVVVVGYEETANDQFIYFMDPGRLINNVSQPVKTSWYSFFQSITYTSKRENECITFDPSNENFPVFENEVKEFMDGYVLTIEKPDNSNPFPSAPILGDLDGDGRDTAADARLILRWLVDEINYFPINPSIVKPAYPSNSDVDGKRGLTANDAVMILKKQVGLIKRYPVEEQSGVELNSVRSQKNAANGSIELLIEQEHTMDCSEETISIPIYLSGIHNLNSYYLEIRYNQEILDFDEVRNGNLIQSWDAPIINCSEDIIRIAGVNVNSVSGNGEIVQITFTNMDSSINNILEPIIEVIKAEINGESFPIHYSDIPSTSVETWKKY